MSKEYEIKKKNGNRAMTTAKNAVFIGLAWNCYLVTGISFWWGEGGWKFGGRSLLGIIFLGGERMSKFSADVISIYSIHT